MFEIGRCFAKDAEARPVAGYAQTLRIAALAWGGVQLVLAEAGSGATIALPSTSASPAR